MLRWGRRGEPELGFDAGSQPGQRGAELVGGVGAERPFSGHEVVEAAGGGGERGGGLVDLGDPAGRHGYGEVAVAEAHRGVA